MMAQGKQKAVERPAIMLAAKRSSPKSAARQGRKFPLLFSGPMVRAILADNKSQTRRPVTFQNSTVLGYACKKLWAKIDLNSPETYKDKGPDPFGHAGYEYLHARTRSPDEDGAFYRVRPRRDIGDRLWVKEEWRVASNFDDYSPSELMGDEPEIYGGVRYLADGDTDLNGRTRRSIYMPRWASRVTLEITKLRVERLQDISEEDAIAEGMQTLPNWRWYPTWAKTFCHFWNSIHKPESQWEKNPWVWVISFRKI